MSNCSNCKFSNRDFKSGALVCRRYPPVPVVGPSGQVGAASAMVMPEHWCGEFAPMATEIAPAKGGSPRLAGAVSEALRKRDT